MDVRLVVVGDLDSTSGGFLYDRRLVARLRERGHAVDVVSLSRRSYGRRLLDNLRSVETRLDGADIVVEDGLAHPSLLAANRRLDRPVVALLHMLASRDADGLDASFAGAVERRFLLSVDAVIHNGETTRADARRLGAPERDVVAPPAGDRFDAGVTPREIRQRAAEGGPLDVVFLGNVVERKGLDPLVDALAVVDADWRLTIVGDTTVEPSHVAAVRGRIERLGIADDVRFTGRVDDDAVASRLRGADVLAVPSRYEPFGIVYLEAMSFGCVPIATERGGADEFVTDGESGYVVAPVPAVVADRIERLDDRERLAKMGVAARRAYERRPTWDESLDRAVDFLEDVGA